MTLLTALGPLRVGHRWGNIARRDELDEEVYSRPGSLSRVGKHHSADTLKPAEVVDRAYTATEQDNSRAHAALEPNHSHFVLVDNGEEGKCAWGGEIALRRQVMARTVAARLAVRVRHSAATPMCAPLCCPQVEQLICLRYGVPMVSVVGGRGWLHLSRFDPCIKGLASLLAHHCWIKRGPGSIRANAGLMLQMFSCSQISSEYQSIRDSEHQISVGTGRPAWGTPRTRPRRGII